jgi:hypothetical protein
MCVHGFMIICVHVCVRLYHNHVLVYLHVHAFGHVFINMYVCVTVYVCMCVHVLCLCMRVHAYRRA